MKRKPLIAAPTPLAHAAEYMLDVEMQHKIDLLHEQLTQIGENTYTMKKEIHMIRGGAKLGYMVACVALVIAVITTVMRAMQA